MSYNRPQPYNPVRDGIEKAVLSVGYNQAAPPLDLSRFVHSFWELKTETPLAEDFHLHVLPDACVNILFNQLDTRIAGVTALQTTFTDLNLGRSFHYVGIQFLPGVWRGNQNEIADSFVGTPYKGTLPLVKTNAALAGLDFSAQQAVMSALVRQLIEQKFVVINVVTEKILANLETIHTAADMAAVAGKSPRQLQRILKQTTGVPPHDFLKIMRLQRSFQQHYLESYADQSHFIHSFRKITGYTPEKYAKKFNV